MHWSAFGHSNMFDRRWHLRRERFVVYQLAMLICLAAECTATYSLDKYQDLEKHVEHWPGSQAHLFRRDIYGAQVMTIVFCVLVATLFGADFFFLLFFPRRRYPSRYTITKKILAVFITVGVFASALMSTIVIARNSAIISRVSATEAQALTDLFFRPPLQYKKWAVNIAWVCLLWLGFISTAASTVILFIAADWDAVHGTDPRDDHGSTMKEKPFEPADTGSP
ncbi:hypothetical protein L218DRAFT_968409 [Marasmius fiardii PR-910]|nr:hypothetical protein L218DRAFT_968409 [Marasmius fiardii PR-910]